MGLFGKRCVRCGDSAGQHEFEGAPTCSECEARIRMAREEPRHCPVDGRDMRKDVVLGIVIDRCPGCGGVWLDAGELQLLRDVSQREMIFSGVLEGIAPRF